MFPGRKVPLLCRALLSRTLPPAGGADSLLSCRLRALPAVSHSDYPGGGSREDAPESARARLLRRAWGRSLSPLDRVSRMIPPELLSKEVQDLRGPALSSPAGEGPLDQVTPPPSSTFHAGQEDIGASAPLLGGEVRDLRGPALSSPAGEGPLDQVTPPLSSTFHAGQEDIGASAPLLGGEVRDLRGPALSSPAGEGPLDQVTPPSSSTFHAGQEDIGASAPLLGGEVQDLQGPALSSPAGEGPLDQVTPPPSSTFHAGQEDIGASAPLLGGEVQDLRGPALSSPAGEGPLDQVTPPPSSTFHAGQEDIGALAPLLGREVRDLWGPECSIPPGKGSLHQVAPPPSSLGGPFHVEHKDVGAPGPPRRNEVSGGFENLAPPHVEGATENTSSPHPPTPTPEADGDLSPRQGAPFCPGDLLLAEYQRKHRSVFRKMFLLKPHGKLVSNWGAIGNQDIMGQLPGQRLLTSTGHTLLLRRPSLEEYVCFMKRGPNIAYPKDMAAMMMAMDVGPGDVVLEAGSGSGACSLFLSRAVGSEGAVYSFEVRADHHDVAKRNFSNWRKAWQIRSGGRTWPDNVRFINKSVTDAFPDIQSVAFDAAALDMLNPQVALPVITRNLKPGAVCAVYIANITQVIDLLEGIRCCKLPLVCEKIVEVGVTDWLVAPSVRKDGKISKRVEPQTPEQLHREEEEEDDDETDGGDEGPAGSEAFGQVPYIARPLPWQTGHTAFLAHLRKFIPTPPTDPEDSS